MAKLSALLQEILQFMAEFLQMLPVNAQQPLKAELRHCQESGVFLAQQLTSLSEFHVGECNERALNQLSNCAPLSKSKMEHVRENIRNLASGSDLSMTSVAKILVRKRVFFIK